jgi:hypothetical protein
MNGKSREVAERPSAEPAEIREVGFFCAVVSFFGEGTEKNDCFSSL